MTIITNEDRKIVRDYIIYNLTIRTLQHELKDAESLTLKMKSGMSTLIQTTFLRDISLNSTGLT
jgi:hypothetical protein